MIRYHRTELARAVREQRLHLTRHVQPSRWLWADALRLGVVLAGYYLALIGVGYLAGAL